MWEKKGPRPLSGSLSAPEEELRPAQKMHFTWVSAALPQVKLTCYVRESTAKYPNVISSPASEHTVKFNCAKHSPKLPAAPETLHG